MISWISKRWRATQRRTDMSTLWPACKEHATSLDDAKMAFYMHASNDTAWTTDYSEGALIDFVEQLR